MSFNGKSTLEKGGRDPPDVSLEYIVNDLLSYFNEFKSLDDAKTEAEKKYGIKKGQDDCWPADDIKRAWGKTQRLEETSPRRRHWTLVIMLQVIQKQQAGTFFQSCAELSVLGARKRREMEEDEDDLLSTGDIDQDFGNPKRRKEHPEDRSSQSAAEQDTMAAAGAVKQHSGGKRQIYSSGQTDGVSQGLTGTPNTVRSQNTGNNRGGFNRRDGPAGALIQTQNNNCREGGTIYIRIPRFVMIHNELRVIQQLRNIRSDYKLIDGLPVTEIDSVIRKRQSYVMSFNRETMNANWVYEILNRQTLAENPVEAAPFEHNYDRGHLAAAANHRWCREALNDANLFSNIVPQHQTLNRGAWLALENDCRRRARAPNIRNVHVYSGPLYLRDMNPRVIQGKSVPSHFFKVIIEENEDGTVQLQCHQTPNGNLPGDNLRTDTSTFLRSDVEHGMINHGAVNERDITIEDIQEASGLTFIAIRPNVRPEDREITVRLLGEDGNAVLRIADIQITTTP